MNPLAINHTPQPWEQPQPRDAVRRVGLQELLTLLRRHRGLIVWTTLAVLMLVVGVLLARGPRYAAMAEVMIDYRKQNIMNVQDVLSGPQLEFSTVESEIEIIRSTTLARRVIKETGLDQTAEFNPSLRPPLIERLIALWPDAPTKAMEVLRTAETALRDIRGAMGMSSGTSPANVEVGMVNHFLKSLQVKPVGRSMAIQVTFVSEDPARAATVANTIAQLYTDHQIQMKQAAAQRATTWLNSQVQELRGRVIASERAVAGYRRQSDLQNGRLAALPQERLSAISERYVTAQAELQARIARLNSIQEAIRSNGSRAIFNFYDRNSLDGARKQEADLNRQYARIMETLGPKHPAAADIQAQLSSVRQHIESDARNLLVEANKEVEVARSNVRAVASMLDEAKGKVADTDEVMVGLRALEREADANRGVLEALLRRVKETEEMHLFRSDAWIASQAEVPQSPTFPSIPIGSLIGVVLGFGLGVILALTRELLDKGIHSLDDIERELNVPALGLLPRLSTRLRRHSLVPHALLSNPHSDFAEAHKSLLVSLVMLHNSTDKCIMVTSSLPGEGKSTAVAALAQTAVCSGRRVLVIDADLRRPSLHRLLGFKAGPGLGDYLEGRASVDSIIQSTGNGLDFIGAGRIDDPIYSLLAGPRLPMLLQLQRTVYDLILVDSPPVLPVADSKILATSVDACMLVVRWQRCRSQTARFAIKELSDAGANVFGAVLSHVDLHRHRLYGVGDAEKYSQQCRTYYRRLSA